MFNILVCPTNETERQIILISLPRITGPIMLTTQKGGPDPKDPLPDQPVLIFFLYLNYADLFPHVLSLSKSPPQKKEKMLLLVYLVNALRIICVMVAYVWLGVRSGHFVRHMQE